MTSFAYRHIIWDWNGTLLDDAWLCLDIINGMLAKRGHPVLTAERYATIFDFPVRDYYALAGFDFARESFEVLSDEFIAEYARRVGECGLRAGAREALAWAQANGLSQSILSAMQQATLDRLLNEHGLRGYFSDVNGLDNHHAAGKVDIGRAWVARQELDPAAMLMIGDTTHDVEVAAALGAACWVIPSGHHARARLAATGARVIESLGEAFG